MSDENLLPVLFAPFTVDRLPSKGMVILYWKRSGDNVQKRDCASIVANYRELNEVRKAEVERTVNGLLNVEEVQALQEYLQNALGLNLHRGEVPRPFYVSKVSTRCESQPIILLEQRADYSLPFPVVGEIVTAETSTNAIEEYLRGTL